jgi:DnaJ-class molecular chaperone
MKYFNYSMTEEEAKARYRELAMQHHPDKGGSVEVMKTINTEYAELKQYLKNPLPKMKPGHTGAYYEKQHTNRTSPDNLDFLKDIFEEVHKKGGIDWDAFFTDFPEMEDLKDLFKNK